jgi:hypothetical protein
MSNDDGIGYITCAFYMTFTIGALLTLFISFLFYVFSVIYLL